MSFNLAIPKNYLYLLRLTFIFFLIQITVRVVLLASNSLEILDFLYVLANGLVWDLFAWSFMSLPIFFMSTFFPGNWITRFSNSKISTVLTWIFTAVWVFVGICEYNFWHEFHSRFNFIAVDYLVYTNEVLANLQESLPMNLIYSTVVLAASALTYLSLKINVSERDSYFLKKSSSLTLFGVIIPLMFLNFIGPTLEVHEKDFREDQLSRNGWVEFARAFRSNKIDYKAFYKTIDDNAAEEIVKSKVPLASMFSSPFSSKPNVVLIVVESLGAKFIKTLGGQESTTPFLNDLSGKSIFFENLYATGTRTVRGLEAINLSLPPTPGYAVVKRPEHRNLYSLGNSFKQNGYKPVFFYGGRGFFDNMNSFFEGNGFSIIDQKDFRKEEITFKNAWGVCDEDLFYKATKYMDEKTDQEPSLLFLLTTSNHRPFTYPNGKIDIPSGESRAGAVKYTDYAIGNFINQSLRKPWSRNTLFVIVADHSTEGRGRFDLEMEDFHIPLWIYAPSILKPEKIQQIVSQIDLLPSLIHLLNLRDKSPFFGHSFFNENWKEERAFVGNYQYVGFYKDSILTTLGPNRAIRSFSFDKKSKIQNDITSSPYVEETAAYYQYASNLLSSGLYKLKRP